MTSKEAVKDIPVENAKMTVDEYIDAFVKKYGLNEFFSYVRCSGRNLMYKKVLIWVLREKLCLTFPDIAEKFHNNHATIMYHYDDVAGNYDLRRLGENAWEIYTTTNKL